MTYRAGLTPCPTPRNNSSLCRPVCQEKNAQGQLVASVHEASSAVCVGDAGTCSPAGNRVKSTANLLARPHRPLAYHKNVDVRAGFGIAPCLRAEEHEADKPRPIERLNPSPQLCDQALQPLAHFGNPPPGESLQD